MQTNRGSGGIAPIILNVGTGGECSVSHPGRFTCGENLRYPPKRVGGFQSQAGRFGGRIYFFPQIVQRVAWSLEQLGTFHSYCKAGTIVATSYAALNRGYGLSVFQIHNPGKEMHLSSPDLWL